jgi:hypothetical protein
VRGANKFKCGEFSYLGRSDGRDCLHSLIREKVQRQVLCGKGGAIV